MTKQINAFKMAQAQFDSVAQLLNLDPQVAEMLRWPTREYTFQIPVKMGDGGFRVFAVETQNARMLKVSSVVIGIVQHAFGFELVPRCAIAPRANGNEVLDDIVGIVAQIAVTWCRCGLRDVI